LILYRAAIVFPFLWLAYKLGSALPRSDVCGYSVQNMH